MADHIRCKLQVSQIIQYSNVEGKTVRLQAIYDNAIPEDARFHQATPSGHLEMFVNNPVALEKLRLGRSFYVDLSPVED